MNLATKQRGGSGSAAKIMTTKLLCDVTGTRYYKHNTEIDYSASKVVNVFDENDVNVGHLPFGEVY